MLMWLGAIVSIVIDHALAEIIEWLVLQQGIAPPAQSLKNDVAPLDLIRREDGGIEQVLP